MRQRLLLRIYQLTRHYAWWVLMVTLTLAIVALVSLRDLKIRSSFQDLLPRDDPILERFAKHQEAIQEAEVITILLTLRSVPLPAGSGVARLLQAGQRVQQALEQEEEIASVSYRQRETEPPALPNLLYFTEQSLQELKETLSPLQAAVEGMTPLPVPSSSLSRVYAEIATALQQLLSGLGVLNPQKLAEALQQLGGRLEQLRQLNERVYQILDRLPDELPRAEEQVDELAQLTSTWQSALQPPAVQNEAEYLLSKDQRALLVQVWPRQSSRFSLAYNRQITQRVREILASLDIRVLEIDWGLRGPYVFTTETDDALRRDMERTALITHIGVLVLFIVVLKRIFYPVLAMLPILMALIFTLVGAKLSFGGLNLLTAFLPAIVLGMGIDYGIQFISHYMEERGRSRRIAPALRATLVTKGSAMLIAAAATSLVLLGLGVVARSTGLSEMGYIVGLGVLLSCLLTIVVLPALIIAAHAVLGRRFRGRPARPWDLQPVVRVLLGGRWVVVGLILVGTALMIWPASRVQFSFITDALMPTNLPGQRVRAYIAEHFELKQAPDLENYFLFFLEPDEGRVRRIAQELDQLEAVDRVESFYNLIPDPQELEGIKGRLAQLQDVNPLGLLQQEALHVRSLQEQFARRGDLEVELRLLAEQLQRGQDSILAATGDVELAQELAQLEGSTHQIRERLEQLRPVRLEDQLQVLRVKLDALIAQVRAIMQTIPAPEEIERFIQNPPAQVRSLFFTPEGQTIVYAHVRSEWLWNSIRYDEFIQEASAIWSDYLGLPMMRATLEGYMKSDFWRSTALAVLIILIVLWFNFRRTPLRGGVTWLSLVTLGLGYLWMLGMMKLLGIDFNVANILISALLIGLGVDNCVYLFHRYYDLGGRSIERATTSTALPILANALATMIGFGSLMLAETSALRVLGQSAVMGIGFMTLFSLTFLPTVLALRQR
jgi:predicted RND superfamily exporter protein